MTLMTQPWLEWEDYAAGMYGVLRAYSPALVRESVRLLSDEAQFWECARDMVTDWPAAARHNLNLPTGKRAWIGQASCCYHHGATAEETCAAWGLLCNATQRRANSIADRIAADYFGGRWTYAETLFDL